MASFEPVELGTSPRHLTTGAIAGLIAGIAFGAIMSHTEMMQNVAALVDLDQAWQGWVLHYVFSIVFGVIFAVIVSLQGVSTWADRPSRGVLSGIVYGVAVWIIGAAFIMPFWMGVVQPADPPVPNWNWMSFAGHLAYGVMLGVLYPVLVAHEPE